MDKTYLTIKKIKSLKINFRDLKIITINLNSD